MAIAVFGRARLVPGRRFLYCPPDLRDGHDDNGQPDGSRSLGARPQGGRRLRDRRRTRAPSRCWSLAALLAFLPGFFQIPPIDRDEARFAQATKQMIETGDYVDIRFQDEVRYKKPVGIYWLQAGVVKAAEALGVPRRAHDHLALSHSLADRRDRRGAADLLGGARLRLAPRRAAGRPDDGDLDPARRRGARSPRPTPCCC